MLLIYNTSTKPSFNLALEEYVLTRMDQEAVILWRNSQAVIVGNNQNTVEEVDLNYVREHAIAVIRRLSGGGAVFHDLGNINYTLILKMQERDFGGYEKFTAPICAYLKTLGVDAYLEGRNDLLVAGRKFSGNAQAVRKNRLMHHGCVLFSADFDELSKALQPKAEKIESKAIKSVRKRVTNLLYHLPSPMTAEEFLAGLADYFRTRAEGMVDYVLTAEDLAAVNKLTAEKYATWEWNFGASPAYNWQNSKRYPFGIVDARLDVRRGVIEDIHIFGDFFGVLDKQALEDRLRGVRHEREAVAAALRGVNLAQYIYGISLEELLELIC